MWPSTTKLFAPDSRPSRTVASMLDTSQLPDGSVTAKAAKRSPAATGASSSTLSASVPAYRIAVAANTVEEK